MRCFLLQFGQNIKRISMSTSMGSYVLKNTEEVIFRNALRKFSHISVREDFAKNQLKTLTDKEIKVLLDPTLLLNKKQWWDNFAKYSKYANKTEKYIVTYFVGGEKNKYKSAVREYKEKLNLPVWTIQYSNYNWKESNKKILGASILDFYCINCKCRFGYY